MLVLFRGVLEKSVRPAYVKWKEDVCALMKGHAVSNTLRESFQGAIGILKNSQGLLKIL